MTQIVDGKKIAEEILQDLKIRVEKLKSVGKIPSLAVLLVGDDKPSHTYVKKKQQAAENIGIKFLKFTYPSTINADMLKQEIKNIQANNDLSGMILQLPVPEKLWRQTREIVNEIDIDIDVDCLSHLALGKVLMGEHKLIPPTPGAILEILKYYQVDLKNKKICLVGRGDLIGKPLAALLMQEPVTLTICGRDSDLAKELSQADIVISGVGKKQLITQDMIKPDAIVIDAGFSVENDKVYGDIDFTSVVQKTSLITPTPGGVGPITIAKLLENVVKIAENKISVL